VSRELVILVLAWTLPFFPKIVFGASAIAVPHPAMTAAASRASCAFEMANLRLRPGAEYFWAVHSEISAAFYSTPSPLAFRERIQPEDELPEW